MSETLMKKFRDLYKGETMWIVGKGPSLQYLAKENFKAGPIITVNDAIIQVEGLDLPNPTFSMWKDGGNRRKYWGAKTKYKHPVLKPDCDYTPNCGKKCGNMVVPTRGATLLVHEHESLHCFPDYLPRHVFCFQKLGFLHNQFSLVIAIRIGKLMGCKSFRFVSFDVHVNGSYQVYIPGIGLRWGEYRSHAKRLKSHLIGLDYKWITPGRKEQKH